MKLKESVLSEPDFTAAVNFNNVSSSQKIKEFLAAEKSVLQKENEADNIALSPAPFYNELHFANYE